MSKSTKDYIENYYSNVKAKSGLKRVLLDKDWHEFNRQLQYRQEWSGKDVILVNLKSTSQTCANLDCNHTSE